MGAKLSKPRDPTDTECHGSNCRWDNGIFTPSFNSEGEVASIPLKQREEQRQAFSKEGVLVSKVGQITSCHEGMVARCTQHQIGTV